MQKTTFVIHSLVIWFVVVIGNLTFIASYEVSGNFTSSTNIADQSIMSQSGYTNDTSASDDSRSFDEDDDDDGDEMESFWSGVLEDWTLRQGMTREGREGRIIQTNRYIPTTSGNFYISRRIGEAFEPEPVYRRPTMNTGKVISQQGSNPNAIPQSSGFGSSFNSVPTRQNFGGNQQQFFGGGQQGGGSSREVSETDLYLLSAIEKLVYRVDYLEQRLRRTEQVVYYLTAGNKEHKPEANLCPENFTRIGDTCYFFGTDRGLNWKSANTMCKSLGAHLAEFDTKAKYREVISVITNSASQRGKDYWLGGLNPGLLWIWSNAGKPVNPNFNISSLATAQPQNATKIVNNKKKEKIKEKPVDSNGDDDGPQLEIKGNGRCLRLSFNTTSKKYEYFGQECSIRHNYLCEIVDKTVDNEIKRIAKELNLG